MTQDENMAFVRWDFTQHGHRISGRSEVRSVTVAREMVEILNIAHGEGSHWLEECDYTWEDQPKLNGVM